MKLSRGPGKTSLVYSSEINSSPAKSTIESETKPNSSTRFIASERKHLERLLLYSYLAKSLISSRSRFDMVTVTCSVITLGLINGSCPTSNRPITNTILEPGKTDQTKTNTCKSGVCNAYSCFLRSTRALKNAHIAHKQGISGLMTEYSYNDSW